MGFFYCQSLRLAQRLKEDNFPAWPFCLRLLHIDNVRSHRGAWHANGVVIAKLGLWHCHELEEVYLASEDDSVGDFQFDELPLPQSASWRPFPASLRSLTLHFSTYIIPESILDNLRQLRYFELTSYYAMSLSRWFGRTSPIETLVIAGLHQGMYINLDLLPKLRFIERSTYHLPNQALKKRKLPIRLLKKGVSLQRLPSYITLGSKLVLACATKSVKMTEPKKSLV